jgi:hypothetical protein
MNTASPDTALLEQLSAYCDGELGETERRFFERRLQNDPELRAALARWRHAGDCLREGRRPRGDDLCAVLRQRIDGEVRRPGRSGARWSWAAAAALAVVGLALAPWRQEDPANAPSALAGAAPAVDAAGRAEGGEPTRLATAGPAASRPAAGAAPRGRRAARQISPVPDASGGPVVLASREASGPVSPLPDDLAVSDFPLRDDLDPAWPLVTDPASAAQAPQTVSYPEESPEQR